MEQIACKECTSPYCHGCNMYRLERMLMSGKLDALMDEKRTIKMDADVRPVVLCRDCKWCHAGYCEKYDDLIPFGCANKPWEDWFCADGIKREES